MTIEDLLSPKSKHSMYIHQTRYMELSEVYLKHLFLCLDVLSENKETMSGNYSIVVETYLISGFREIAISIKVLTVKA